MTAAIKGNPTENNKARTYGAIFINYHPYYYRGVAYLNLGRYEQAIADLEQTTGPGPENLGSIGELLDRAKRQLAASAPEPEPVRPEPVRPTVTQTAPAPVQPAAPQIDPALRQRATAAIAAAKQKVQLAQRRAPASTQYAQAVNILTDATTRSASAKSNDDLNNVITMADNAGDLADLAMPPNVPAPTPAVAVAPAPSRPTVAADAVLSDYKQQLRRALEDYFNGEFDDASRQFSDLTRKLPTNGWIWAFLGASQYSQYRFEADESYRSAALRSFRRAKQLRSWKGGLPEKYFSKRIRRAFDEEG